MANIKSAKKRAIQTEKRNARNRSVRSTLRTAVVRTPGGPDAIEIIDVPVVEPGLGEVRVEIAAAPVNPLASVIRSGRASSP